MRRRQLFFAPVCLWGACQPAWAQSPPAPDGRRDWFGFLESGRPVPNTTPEEKTALAAMQKGHIDNFKRLHGERKLFAAGPLRDPGGVKRGIVVVRAQSAAEVQSYFQPDDYVREGWMLLRATPCVAQRALNSEGIDPEGIEEVRIVLVPRPAADDAAARHALLRRLLEAGTVGAWYTMDGGDLAEVLFARSTDTAALQAALAPLPGVRVLQQWIGKRVVPDGAAGGVR